MRLPRDLSGYDLAKTLKVFGYSVARQTGSHMCLTTLEHGEHHMSFPHLNNFTLTFPRKSGHIVKFH